MATDGNAMIEALEHQLMRGWAAGDAKAIRKLVSRRFRLVLAASPPVLLDAKSWLDAVGGRFAINRFGFGDVYCRVSGATAIFAAEVALAATIDGVDASGTYWLTDQWQRGQWNRRWRLTERQLSRPLADERVRGAVKSLQLWR